ncbi:MAG: hypothetical protein HY831_00980 [Candidatus Aenigmarchaeota archaeon]|nr:hypothetical protein [Candidatus Aenigmarchaeota archaeon]
MEKKELLVVVMIGVLLLVTAMQTVTLAGMVTAGPAPVKAVTSSNSQSSSSGSGSSDVSSLDSLPSMVGGC